MSTPLFTVRHISIVVTSFISLETRKGKCSCGIVGFIELESHNLYLVKNAIQPECFPIGCSICNRLSRLVFDFYVCFQNVLLKLLANKTIKEV